MGRSGGRAASPLEPAIWSPPSQRPLAAGVNRSVGAGAGRRDPTVKGAVRDALGLPAEAPLDRRNRILMRRRILSLAPLAPRVSDRAVAALALAGLPGLWLIRGLAVAMLCAMLLASVAVASAQSLPDEPLYAAKLAVGQVRLAIAVTPQDRAVVEISIAEQRLHEAERLAAKGAPASTLLAAGAYAAHVASAAAALAESDATAPERAALVEQFELKLEQQRARVAIVADRLAAEPRTASAAAALRPVATTPQSTHADRPARIAETAAAVGNRIAAVAVEAEERAGKDNRGQAPALDRGPSPRETTERTRESAKKAEDSRERARRAAAMGTGDY